MSAPHELPEDFRDLARFVSRWAITTEAGRAGVRRRSSMEEILEFYNALLPRLDAIIVYLKQFPLASLTEPARCLLCLAMAGMEIAPAVELYRNPDVVYAFDAERFEIALDPPI